MENENFSAFLNEKMRQSGIDIKKLSQISGISLKNLEGLAEGDVSKLPPLPYIRGYLIKLGQILNFDPEEYWQMFKNHELIKSSGPKDLLPRNRFTRKGIGKRLALISAGIVLIVYFSFRIQEIIGIPTISLTYPDKDIINTSQSSITLTGLVKNANQLFINGEVVSIEKNGFFEKEAMLTPGLNTIQIKAKKFLGRETTLIRQVIFEPPLTSNTSTDSKAESGI